MLKKRDVVVVLALVPAALVAAFRLVCLEGRIGDIVLVLSLLALNMLLAIQLLEAWGRRFFGSEFAQKRAMERERLKQELRPLRTRVVIVMGLTAWWSFVTVTISPRGQWVIWLPTMIGLGTLTWVGLYFYVRESSPAE